jgi:hypothetical protein
MPGGYWDGSLRIVQAREIELVVPGHLRPVQIGIRTDVTQNAEDIGARPFALKWHLFLQQANALFEAELCMTSHAGSSFVVKC